MVKVERTENYFSYIGITANKAYQGFSDNYSPHTQTDLHNSVGVHVQSKLVNLATSAHEKKNPDN